VDLNQLLTGKGIDLREVLVFRHRPTEPELNKVLPLLAADRPDLFNAYQQTHGETVERAMTKAGYVASFIGHEPGKALFVGLYKIGKSKTLTHGKYWQVPAYVELKKLGMTGFLTESRSACLWFDLTPIDFYASWKGKMIVDWPPPERSWWRRANRNTMTVHAILEDSALGASVRFVDFVVRSSNSSSRASAINSRKTASTRASLTCRRSARIWITRGRNQIDSWSVAIWRSSPTTAAMLPILRLPASKHKVALVRSLDTVRTNYPF